MINRFFLLLSITVYTSLSYALDLTDLKQECLYNKKYSRLNIEITCDNLYHHYNAKASSRFYDKEVAIKKENFKISEFNVLHAGMRKTKFKDFSRVAKIINKFDVVGVTELIPVVAGDLDNNEKVLEYLKDTPNEIQSIKASIYNLKRSLRRPSRGTKTKERNLILLQKKLSQLEEDLEIAKSLYRMPGYIQILEELHKLKNGEEWALILNPQGEGAESSPTKELVGYYYRSSIIKPKSNEYCLELKRSQRIESSISAIACTLQMDDIDFPEDRRDVISRRPFLAEFISGNFSFTLITSHVLFDEPKESALQNKILTKAFKVNDYEHLNQLEDGLRKDNYARFAEVKMTLDFIQNYEQKFSKNEDVIYMGDFNLESQNPFWNYILPFWENAEIYQNELSSLTTTKSKDGEETNGGSSNYDHFIFNPLKTSECVYAGEVQTGVLNFTQGLQGHYIDRTYLIRNDSEMDNKSFLQNSDAVDKLLNKKVIPYTEGDQTPLTIGSKTVTYLDKNKLHKKASRGVIVDRNALKDFEEDFKDRIIDSQLSHDSYYYFYAQIVSDHFPIYLNCRSN